MLRTFDPKKHCLRVNVIRAKTVFKALTKPRNISTLQFCTISYFRQEMLRRLPKVSNNLPFVTRKRVKTEALVPTTVPTSGSENFEQLE